MARRPQPVPTPAADTAQAAVPDWVGRVVIAIRLATYWNSKRISAEMERRQIYRVGHTYIDGCWYATLCPPRDWEFWYSIYSDPACLSRWHCGTPAQLIAALEGVRRGVRSVI